MADEDLCLDSELTVGKLAAKLDTPSNLLSQALNEERGESFKAVPAYYRVQKSCEMMTNPVNSEKSIVDSAVDTGITENIKFYRQFKCMYGQTLSSSKNSSQASAAR